MARPPIGTPEYYKLPIAERLKDAKAGQTMTGGVLPGLAFLTPDELRYLRAVAVPTDAWAQNLKSRYPDQAPYLDIPEIANLLREATDNQWPPDQVASHLTQTNWWLTHTPEQRQWHILNATDPVAAWRSVQQQMVEILKSASSYGVKMDAGNAMVLATAGLSAGWSRQEILDHLLDYDTQGYNYGTLGATKDQLRGLSTDYLVPLTDGGLNDWTKKIASGRTTLEVFKNQMAEKAKSMFQDAGIRQALDDGMTIKQFADPYMQQAGELLGLNPADIDLNQAKWRKALDYYDPASKSRRAQTLAEWTTNLKVDGQYGYDNSKHGMNAGAGLISEIQRRFGVTG